MLLMRILVAHGRKATIRNLLLTFLFRMDFYFKVHNNVSVVLLCVNI